jgi:hypothetical protein
MNFEKSHKKKHGPAQYGRDRVSFNFNGTLSPLRAASSRHGKATAGKPAARKAEKLAALHAHRHVPFSFGYFTV